MSNAMLGLTFWEGHLVESFSEQADGSLVLQLTEDPDTLARCGCCGEPCVLIHERRRRRVRERDWFDRRVWLDVPIRRMDSAFSITESRGGRNHPLFEQPVDQCSYFDFSFWGKRG